MKRDRHLAAGRRSAFTLIELLVVIAIIAVLAGLLLGGVMAVLRTGPAAIAKADIQQFSAALDKFKTDNKCHPPSLIKLCSNYSDYGNTQLDNDSKTYLAQIWPNLGASFAGMNWANRTGPTAPVFGSLANPQIDILEGDQCLVFFLNGPPGMNGFSTNPQNPLENPPPPAPSRVRYKEFAGARLINRVTVAYPAGHPFPSYQDGYGSLPYMYFSSNRRPDGYDPATTSLGVAPYISQTNPRKFYNSNSFQLISAGPDGIRWVSPWAPPAPTTGGFGPGGFWTPATGPPAIGMDDISNFHERALGIP